jgi:hypothetical protein
MNKNEETESLMIENVPELIEAVRMEVVVGEVATAATEFLAAAPFAIHVAMHRSGAAAGTRVMAARIWVEWEREGQGRATFFG